MVSAITGIGSAFPYAEKQEELWEGFFSAHFDDSAIARRLFASSSLETRHSVVSPLVEDVSDWSTGKRMERYALEAFPLARSAVISALEDAQLSASDIGMFVVVSCTGYATPGLDTRIAETLGMRSDTERLVIGHMGCHAALPAMRTASNYVNAAGRPAVVVCVEVASLHLQPPTTDVEQMVAHSLFSDAASAAVIEPVANHQTGQLEIVDVEVATDAANADLMTWLVTDKGFRMGLSQRVPDALSKCVAPAIDSLLTRHGLGTSDIAKWAVHPGGPRILDVVAQELKLKPDDLDVSRSVLATHGNCSSATIFVVLQEMLEQIEIVGGQYIVAMAFGPGLTLCATLLRRL